MYAPGQSVLLKTYILQESHGLPYDSVGVIVARHRADPFYYKVRFSNQDIYEIHEDILTPLCWTCKQVNNPERCECGFREHTHEDGQCGHPFKPQLCACPPLTPKIPLECGQLWTRRSNNKQYWIQDLTTDPESDTEFPGKRLPDDLLVHLRSETEYLIVEAFFLHAKFDCDGRLALPRPLDAKWALNGPIIPVDEEPLITP